MEGGAEGNEEAERQLEEKQDEDAPSQGVEEEIEYNGDDSDGDEDIGTEEVIAEKPSGDDKLVEEGLYESQKSPLDLLLEHYRRRLQNLRNRQLHFHRFRRGVIVKRFGQLRHHYHVAKIRVHPYYKPSSLFLYCLLRLPTDLSAVSRHRPDQKMFRVVRHFFFKNYT